MRKRIMSLATMLTVAALGMSNQASASTVPIVGNDTSVELTSFDALTGLGLSVSALGSATVDASGAFPVATFGITGGKLDTETGFAVIQHDGSGLGLTDGTTAVSLENFLIDTQNGILTGDVSVNQTFVATVGLFSIQEDLTLLLTGGAAETLNSVYGTELPEGLEIGIASVDVAVVPVPAALPLMLTALAGLGLTRRRRV